jgi:hypothetical protein
MPPDERLIRRIADQRMLNPTATDAEVVEKTRAMLERDFRNTRELHRFASPEIATTYEREQLRLLDEYAQQGITSKHGHMYEVNLHVDPDRLLQWDRPLGAQSRHVQDAVTAHIDAMDTHTRAVREAMLDRGRDSFGRPFKPERLARLQQPIPTPAERTGADVYRLMGFTPGNPPRDIAQGYVRSSNVLRELDVPGIRYLDQGSRAAGEGTHNITLFDDSPIEILRKYGLVPFAPAAAAQLGNTSPQPATKDTPMPQPQADDSMRAQITPGGARRPIVRIIDGVPHEFDPKQADGPTGGWIPQTGMPMPSSATGAGSSAPTFVGPPKPVISRTPTSNAEDLETLKQFLTLTGATAGSLALGPGAAAPWLLRAALGITGATVGGGTGRASADVPVKLFDYAAGRPSSPDTDMGRDFATGAQEGAGLEATSLAAGPALGLAARGARAVGKLGLDVMPRWASRIPGAEDWWRPATAVLRAALGHTAGLPAAADIAATTIPPAASWAAPRLEWAGEKWGSHTLGEQASRALQWLENRLPGILKTDAPGAAAAAAADVESPAVAASRARFQARQGAPAAEAAGARTRVIEPDPTGPVSRPDDLSRRDFFRDPDLPTQPSEWVEGPPTAKNAPVDPNFNAGAGDPMLAGSQPYPKAGAPAAPPAPRPVGRSDAQWRQFRQPPRTTPVGNVPIGAPAVDPGIELNLTGPNVLPPTAADLAAPPAEYGTGSYFTENPSTAASYRSTPPDAAPTATETLQQRAAPARPTYTQQQLEEAHAKMTAANAAAREAEAAAAGPLEGTPNTRTLPTGEVIPWDDAAAEAGAADFDPVAAFNERFGTGEPAARKATAQERRMSALTNKAIRPDLLPESSGLRDAGDLSFDPASGEIGKWADVPETATDRLVRAIQRKK